MHYGAYTFAKNKDLPVIEKLKKTGGQLGNKNGFSDTDVKQLNLLYDCKSKLIPSTLILLPFSTERPKMWSRLKHCKSTVVKAFIKCFV